VLHEISSFPPVETRLLLGLLAVTAVGGLTATSLAATSLAAMNEAGAVRTGAARP
jgi:hypothetical protein